MLKKWFDQVFEEPDSDSFWLVNDTLAAITLISVVLIMLETSEVLSTAYGNLFTTAEYIITAIFTVEYLARIWTADNRRKYLTSFFGVVDLLSILPTYLLLANFQFLKVFRVTRLLRLLRMLRVIKMIRLLQRRYQRREAAREMLRMNVTIYIVSFIIMTIVFSVVLFEVESGISGTQINSLGDALWMVTATLTAVGYGDIVPVSGLGKIVTGFMMVFGVGFLSFAIFTIGRFFQDLLFGDSIEKDLSDLRK